MQLSVSETEARFAWAKVSRVKGFRPVLAHTMDPTNLYIKGLPNNADELLGKGMQCKRYCTGAGDRALRLLHCVSKRCCALRLYLYSIFSPFGAIQSVRLLRDGAGACTGAALLKFGITEDAELAIRTISGNKLPDGVVLDVTVKTVRS